MRALVVAIVRFPLALTSPFLILSPACLSHDTILPSVMVDERATLQRARKFIIISSSASQIDHTQHQHFVELTRHEDLRQASIFIQMSVCWTGG